MAIVVTNIEKEFWAYAFRIAKMCDSCDRCGKGVDDVSNCH
jgi:hypothetical protein